MESTKEQAKASMKRADAQNNRTRILEAARSVFAERGLDLEMNEVATQAHLGVGTLYGHFANREDLLRAVVQYASEDVLAQLRAAVTSHADDPRIALQALVFAGIQAQRRYRPLFAVLRDPRLAKFRDPSYGQHTRVQFLEILKDLLTHGIQAGIFRPDLDLDMAAVIIIGTFSSATDLMGACSSLDELSQRLSRSLLTMLAGNSES